MGTVSRFELTIGCSTTRRPSHTGPNPLSYLGPRCNGRSVFPVRISEPSRSRPRPRPAVATPLTALPRGRAAQRSRPIHGEAEPVGRRDRRRRVPGSVRAHLQQPARLLVGFGESSLPASRFLAAYASSPCHFWLGVEFEGDASSNSKFFEVGRLYFR